MSILPIISNIDDLAQAIDDPPPNRPIERRIGEQGRRICDAYSNVPPWAKNLGNPAIPLLGLVCEPYFENNGISPPVIAPPFAGGQCPAVYVVSYEGLQGGVVQISGTIAARGPIQGIRGRITETNARVIELNCTGVNLGSDSCISIGNSGQGWKFLGGVGSSGPQPTARITSISPCGADDCGDPPPEINPGPSPSPVDPVIPPDEQPYDDPIYGPTLPLPPIIIAPELPDFEISIDPFGNGGSGPSLDPGEPGDAVETGQPGSGGGGDGDGVAEGEAPPGQEIVGLRLDLVEALPLSAQYGDGIYRGGAYIYMGGPNGLDQDFGGSQVQDGQFFYAEREGLTKWRVASNVGLNWSVVPFYREVV